MSSFVQDLRRGLRLGFRQPVATLVALSTLGLAIGAGTAVFSVVHAVLLVPLPVTDPDGLVLVSKQDTRRHFAEFPIFRAELELWQREARGFEILAGMAPERLWSLRLHDGEEPATVQGTAVTGGFFTVLGVGAAHGRTLLPVDEIEGAVRAAMLSEGFWKRRYGGDPGILDRTVSLNGKPFRVVGIAPRDFDHPEGADLWFLLGDDPRAELAVIGRLRPDRSLDQAFFELGALSERYAEQQPEHLQSTRLAVTPWAESVVGSVRRPLWILLAAVLVLLAIASANLAHLKLVEARSRREQLAVRAALGAGRGRLVRQLFAEGMALALAGGLVGIGIAAAGVRLLRALGPDTLPRLQELSLHPWVLAFTVGITGLATLGFSVLPAWSATRTDPADALRGSAAGETRGDTRLLEGLVVTEIALSLVLLLGAGLLARTFLQHQRIEHGFAAEELLSVRLPVSPAEVGDVLAFHRRLLPEIEALPGVTAATPTLTRPLSGSAGFDTRLLAEGQTETAGAASPWINYEAVLPGYLETLGVPLIDGRFFTDSDGEGSAPVAVVNQALAEHLWPGESAVGKRLRFAMPEISWITVVGVVGDTRYRELTTSRLGVYFPFPQTPFQPRYLTVRVAGEPGPVIPPLRETIRAMAPGVPLDDITRVSEVLATGWARPRFNALLLGSFAVIAALVAVVGVFGVMTSRVTRRLRELGIRAALGASPRRLRGWVLGRGMALAGVGVLLGLGGGLALARTLESLLYEVRPHDPATFLGVSLAFLAVAFLALWAPARRAAGADPVRVLRS